MQIILNKIGECHGCVFFTMQRDHEKCRYCERNPIIATALKDNKSKPDKNLLPDDAFTPEQRGELDRVQQANQTELGSAGVAPGAVDRMFQEHGRRGPPATRKR